MRFLRQIWRSGVIGAFLTGLAVFAPLMLTLMILQWIMARLAGAFGPGTWAGDLLAGAGSAVVGPNYSVVAFLLAGPCGGSGRDLGAWRRGARSGPQGVRGPGGPAVLAHSAYAGCLSAGGAGLSADGRTAATRSRPCGW